MPSTAAAAACLAMALATPIPDDAPAPAPSTCADAGVGAVGDGDDGLASCPERPDPVWRPRVALYWQQQQPARGQQLPQIVLTDADVTCEDFTASALPAFQGVVLNLSDNHAGGHAVSDVAVFWGDEPGWASVWRVAMDAAGENRLDARRAEQPGILPVGPGQGTAGWVRLEDAPGAETLSGRFSVEFGSDDVAAAAPLRARFTARRCSEPG